MSVWVSTDVQTITTSIFARKDETNLFLRGDLVLLRASLFLLLDRALPCVHLYTMYCSFESNCTDPTLECDWAKNVQDPDVAGVGVGPYAPMVVLELTNRCNSRSS